MSDPYVAALNYAEKQAFELHKTIILNGTVPGAMSMRTGEKYTCFWGATITHGIWFFALPANGETFKDWMAYLATMKDPDGFGRVPKSAT